MGVFLWGEKYVKVAAHPEMGVLYLRNKEKGVVIQKTMMLALVAMYDESKGEMAGRCHLHLERIAELLIKHNF